MKGYYDIAGDGGSGVVGQIEAGQARIEERLSQVRHRVAVGSGKGGVGKSTLTFHVAAALARQGHRVAVLDADLNGPSQARLAGVDRIPLVPGPAGLLALPEGRSGVAVVSLGSLVPEPRSVEFESVSAGSTHVWRATREFAFLGQLLGAVEWGALDFLFIDLPPGAERTAQHAEFLGPATAFVLVTIPTELACGIVARSIDALGRTGNRVLGYVLNMSGYWCDTCAEIRPLFPGAGQGAALDLPCLGRVPFDPELAAMCDRGIAAAESPDRPAAREIAAVAERIALELR